MGQGRVRDQCQRPYLWAEATMFPPPGWALRWRNWATHVVMRVPRAGSRHRHLCIDDVFLLPEAGEGQGQAGGSVCRGGGGSSFLKRGLAVVELSAL